jgi:diguanylate cyclase (GGDEF)-like protein
LDWYLVVQNSVPEYRTVFFNGVFGAGVFLAFVIIFLSAYFLLWKGEKNQNSHVSQVSVTDPLTGLYNRNYFKDVYGERGVFNTTRYKSIAVFDIDFFKEANDNLDGDAILLHVTEVARRIFEHDEIFRWGGDEFTVLITQNLTQAYDLCYAFAKELEKEGLVTVSVGVTDVRLSDMIKKNYYRAAQACYLVKEMGGNGVKRT